MVKSTEYYIPLGDTIDLEAEREKLLTELKYMQGFLDSVEKKLSNERFISNAKPEIIENERQKQADAISKIELLKASIEGIS